MADTFDDLLSANARYAADFDLSGLDGQARARVAVVTCMDTRIDPLAILQLQPGDATVLRNPGGRVTDQELRALAVAVHLLGVERVLVMVHTRCAMASATEADFRERIGAAAGTDATTETFGAVADQDAALREDVARVRDDRLIPEHVTVGGFRYDVDTGRIHPVVVSE